MEQTVSLRFKYTAEEYVAAIRLYLMRVKDFFIRLAICAVYSIACAALFSWLGFWTEATYLFFLLACFPFFIAFMHLVVIPRQRYRSDPRFHDEYFMQFSDDGIHFKTAQVDSLLQWSLYNKVIENDRFYILVYGKHMISVIPKRAFTDAYQVATFEALLRRNIPSYAKAGRLKAGRTEELAHAYVPPVEPPDWR